MFVFGVILAAFSRIRTENGEIRSISPYSVQMRKNTDRSNSEYGHFLRSVMDKALENNWKLSFSLDQIETNSSDSSVSHFFLKFL